MALAACVKGPEPAEGPGPTVTPSPALAAIDSLTWRRPDSALALLLPWFDTCCAAEYDRHYALLLLAELLYKNDYAQTNRAELRQAVAYFDSLVRQVPPTSLRAKRGNPRGPGGLKHTPPTPNTSIYPFLAARAHYINGVGYYEQDSVVQACKEYIQALEIMEERFGEKELVGKKAKFMAYTYNRLGDMFKEQLLAESAIVCYRQALFYCRRESTSIYGIPVLLYNLGIQYNIIGQNDSADFYYNEALANMPDFDNLHYRDLMVNKNLFAYYNLGYSVDSIIQNLKHLVTLSANEEEKTTRLLTLGNMFFEDKQYDSSRVYLETVFEQHEDTTSKIMAAENLCFIYRLKGDSINAQRYASFLAGFTMSEIEKKTDVSKANEMFQEYLAKKQKKQAETEREKAVKKTIIIIIPIAVMAVLAVVCVLILRNKKQLEESNRMLGETMQEHEKELRQWQAEAEKVLEERDMRHAASIEAERQTHRMEQAAISGRLKRKNQEVRELKSQIRRQKELVAKAEPAPSFAEEPVCRLVMERVNDGRFKAKIDCEIYKQYALDKQQLLDLRVAVDRHFSQFTLRLRKAYPKLTQIDIDYCCLYLLNLTYADVSALMQRAYNTVVERDSKIKKVLGSEKPLPVILMDIAMNPSYN